MEEDYRRADPRHRYTTDLAVLTSRHGLVPAQMQCPDGGRYQVVLHGDHITILCSAPDHEPVSP